MSVCSSAIIALSALRSFWEMADGKNMWLKIRNNKMLRVMKFGLRRTACKSQGQMPFQIGFFRPGCRLEITVTLLKYYPGGWNFVLHCFSESFITGYLFTGRNCPLFLT